MQKEKKRTILVVVDGQAKGKLTKKEIKKDLASALCRRLSNV